MPGNQRAFALTCDACGHRSHITISSEADLQDMAVFCPACGEAAGTLGESEVEYPMVPEERPRQRKMNRDVAAQKYGAQLVRPFLVSITRWQHRSAYLKAKLAAARTSALDRGSICAELSEIHQEVDCAIQDFQRLIQISPQSSRVRDVSLAMTRLDEQLGTLIAASASSIPAAKTLDDARRHRRCP